MKAGDSVLLRGGTYHDAIDFETNGTATQPITISNYNGESPILDGEYTLPTGSVFYFLVKIISDHVSFSNINIQRSAGGGLALGGNYDRAMNVRSMGARETGIARAEAPTSIDGCTVTDTGNGFGINGQNSWGAGISVQGDGNLVQNCCLL